jgi:hypothetical protein
VLFNFRIFESRVFNRRFVAVYRKLKFGSHFTVYLHADVDALAPGQPGDDPGLAPEISGGGER